MLKKEIDYRSIKYNKVIHYFPEVIAGKIKYFEYGNETKEYRKEFDAISEIWKNTNPVQWETYKQNRKIIEDGNFNKTPGKLDIISEVGSKKEGEAGLVPRTYSMGAQPPSLNQPLDEIDTNMEKHEDEYFAHLSNAESDEEYENIKTNEYLEAEKTLENIRKT
ncbi:hypothetical protein JTB14_004555 [Gonioctena quinquepunctata]|nr:hypothetical protein JTB14_004555 [Gonioctena quinquepunctata]